MKITLVLRIYIKVILGWFFFADAYYGNFWTFYSVSDKVFYFLLYFHIHVGSCSNNLDMHIRRTVGARLAEGLPSRRCCRIYIRAVNLSRFGAGSGKN